MYALIEDNAVTQVGELSILFPNTSNPNHAFAIEQGALEVVEGEQKDQRFYWVTFDSYTVNGNVVTRNYINTPKALADNGEIKGLKSQAIQEVKLTANTQLQSTDWMVYRKFERNIDIPAGVVTERAKIISDCAAKELAINACTTIEQLIQVISPVNVSEP